MEGLIMAECKVDPCYAITCMHNKDNKCVLKKVTIDEDAKCKSFRDRREKVPSSVRQGNKTQRGYSTPEWAKEIKRNPYDTR
jgi:hypothetical protein